jgi:S-adenosylmethionine hydrolase
VAIVLFADFGAADRYVGQVKAMLTERAPRAPVLDAPHDAPDFGIEASAHLLTALAGGCVLAWSRTFEEARPGAAFWYANSIGLVEIAASRGIAARAMRLRIGSPVRAV